MNRESLKRHCEEMCKMYESAPSSNAYMEHRLVLELLEQTDALEVINNAHWIDNHNGTISCSHCHTWFNKDDRRYYMFYCPYCNAKMTERYKDCFQPKSNEKPHSSQLNHDEEVAKAFQLDLSFSFIDGLQVNKTQESEVEKNDET